MTGRGYDPRIADVWAAGFIIFAMFFGGKFFLFFIFHSKLLVIGFVIYSSALGKCKCIRLVLPELA